MGLGDSGGDSRDESNNVNVFTKQDSFMSGQGNTAAPSADTTEIPGVGKSKVR